MPNELVNDSDFIEYSLKSAAKKLVCQMTGSVSALLVATLCLLSASFVLGQERSGTYPASVLLPHTPVPEPLDENCVVSILNRTVPVNSDGSWILPTVPANFGLVRARATCVVNGITKFGQSDLFSIAPNQSVNLPNIFLGNVSPIPALIMLSSPATTLTQTGQTAQLSATATYQDGSTQDITASNSGTLYQVSNSAIATVSPDGLVTAMSSGNVLIQAINEGAQGIIDLQVSLGGASNGGIPNSWIISNFCPQFSQGIPCPQLTDASFASEDPDHDGLTNLQEFQNGTDPNNPDTDGDGLTDGQEVLVYHTNPLLFSSDGTGIPDGIEVQTGTLGNTFASKLAAAISTFTVAPSHFLLTVNSLSDIASQQLTVTATLIDGKTKLDLTSTTKGTTYSSSDLTVCNFGAPDGNIFAGNVGPCTITVKNGAFTATANGQVTGFTPTALGFVAIPGFANGVAVNGNFAFVAAGSAGLQVVNVTNRSNPVIAASLALKGNANSVRVVGNLAFVAAGSGGLYAIDITTPTAPAILGNIATTNALDVNIQGNIAYVSNGTNLLLVNVSSPAVMSQISSLPLTGLIRGISVDSSRGLAVVAADTTGIYIVDVSNPAAPVVLSQLATGDAHQVAIKGNFVFVADYHGLSAQYTNSLASVDISSPSSPVIRSEITNQSLGGNLNDVVLSGDLALAADVVFVNGIPITDITDPTNLLSRAIVNFTQRDDNGMGIAVDGTYVYLTTDHSAIEKFGATGDGRLYIGQYQAVQDTFGIPPTVAIASPTTGSTVVQGATIAVTVNAADDVAVASVTLLANGQPVLTNTVVPYVFFYTIPTGISTLTLSATAIDYGGNIGSAASITLNVIPDPGTTVVGRVIDGNQNPLSGFIVQAVGHLTTTASDGTFSIPNVPTVSVSLNALTVQTHGVEAGVVRAGASAPVTPVIGGTTNVGDIITVARPLIIVDSNGGAVTAVDTSQNPPTTSQTIGAFGANADAVSVTPDGSKAFVSINGFGSPIRVFDLTTNPPAYVTDISRPGFISSTLTNVVTSDGRFMLAIWNDDVVTAVDTSTFKILSSLTLPSGADANEIAVTPDGSTVIIADLGANVFRILALSPTGSLSNTGNTISYNFAFWTPNIAMAPDGHFALIANPSANFVSILRIDSQHNVTLSSTRIPISSWPWGIDITPDGSKAYVTVAGAETPVAGTPGLVAVLSIDGNDNITDSGVRITIANGIPLAPAFNQGASGIAIAVDGRAYVANTFRDPKTSLGTITIVDTKTDTVIGTVALPIPSAIGVPR